MNPLDVVGDSVTTRLIGLALDAAVTRQTALAANIANVDTEDYRPLAARFDQMVEELRLQVTDRSKDESTGQLVQSLGETLTNSPLVEDPTNTKVELDMQMAGVTKNLVLYQSLLAAQSKLMSMAQMVITEGKQ
jgi:flagellar basal-body rod protein FlgB